MSAHDQIRAMLDQLMGTARNGEEDNITVKFDDPRVCKSFLLGCCPHEILASTRMDLGECPRVHNLALRADYEKASQSQDYYYDLDALEQLSSFIADADRKTEQAKKRLMETQEELSTDVAIKADKIHELAEKIGESLAKAEQLGEEGLVDESMKLMEEIEALRKQKSEAESEYRACIPAATYQQQKLRVCEVCCAYLGIHDNDRRLADHFGGKLHLGFIKIRETLTEFQGTADQRRRKRRSEYQFKEGPSDRPRAPVDGRDRQDRNRDRGDRNGQGHYRSNRPRSRDRGDYSRRNRRSRSRSKEWRRKNEHDSNASQEKERRRRSRSRSRSRDRKKR